MRFIRYWELLSMHWLWEENKILLWYNRDLWQSIFLSCFICYAYWRFFLCVLFGFIPDCCLLICHHLGIIENSAFNDGVLQNTVKDVLSKSLKYQILCNKRNVNKNLSVSYGKIENIRFLKCNWVLSLFK